MKIRKIAFSGLVFACLFSGLLLRYAGLTEPFQLHPDEQPISVWMDRMYETHSLLPKCYAGGFFVLEDAARKTLEWIVAYPVHRWAYFTRATDRYAGAPPDTYAFGRQFNAWLGTLAIWLVALLTRRVTRSRAGALTAAALMAFAAFAIEHAHYLESDIAMLATLSLSLYLMARSIEKRSPLSLALAAFAAGFAAGTKFPLVLLLAPLLASVRLPRPAAGRPSAPGWLAVLVVLALLLAAAGFVVACPDARHFSEFAAGLKSGESSVYAETARLLGAAAREPHAREWMNGASLVRFAKSLRAGWLLVSAIGFALCFARRLRPFWPVTLLFPALSAWFMVFHAPWLRSQEFMTLLPDFCLWAALPVAALWSARGPARNKFFAVLLFLAALLPVLQTGVAMSSQFGWEDTRRLANRTLKIVFPADRVLGTELYVAPAQKNIGAGDVGIGKYETVEPAFFRSNSIDYVLLNTDAHGRGVQDPRTGKLFPEYAERMETLLRRGQRIAAWGTLASPAPQATFRAPCIELWSLPDPGRSEALEEIGVDLPRPAIVQDEGRTTFFKGKLRAGPRRALLLDKFPREIAIGGPGDLAGPVFLIFSTRERAATVRAQGFGRTERLALGPHDAGVLPLQRPRWNPRWARYERVVVRSETGGPTLTYLPCFLRVAFDPLEAAAILLDDGHPGKAIELLRRQHALENAGLFWRALAGIPAARPEAEALLARWTEWLARDADDPPPAALDGLPLAVWQDFARMRLADPGVATNLYLAAYLARNAVRRTPELARFLPVNGAAQRLALVLGRNPDAFGHTNYSGRVFLDADDRTEIAGFGFDELPDPRREGLRWTTAFGDWPRHAYPSFRSLSGGAIRVEDAELTWNWRDMLALRAAQLRRALAPPATPAPVRYGDWLALRECRVENGEAVLVFEALQDGVPPLAAQLHVRKHNTWRERPARPFADAPWRAGERRAVRLPLENDVAPERLGIAVRTDAQWHSALLPQADAPAERPFPTLADLLP